MKKLMRNQTSLYSIKCLQCNEIFSLEEIITCFHGKVPTNPLVSKLASNQVMPFSRTKQRTTETRMMLDFPVMDFHPNLKHKEFDINDLKIKIAVIYNHRKLMIVE